MDFVAQAKRLYLEVPLSIANRGAALVQATTIRDRESSDDKAQGELGS